MFDDIAYKIKMTAKVVCIVGIVLSCLTGFIMLGLSIVNDEFGLFAAGLILAGVGSLASWVGSFTLYGFGQLIDNTDPNYRNSTDFNYRN